jgi:regulator of sigma D
MNLILIDFLEKLVLDTTLASLNGDGLSTTFQSHMFRYMNQNTTQMSEITQSIESMKESMNSMSTNIVDILASKFLEIRQQYVDEFKIIVNSHTNEQIFPLLEENTHKLIEQTSTMIREIVPQSQSSYYDKIQDSIRQFHQVMMEDTKTLLKLADPIDNNNTIIPPHMNANTNNMFREFLHDFELKSNTMLQNIQQPICSYISSSEERIHSNLANIKDISMKTHGTQEKVSKEISEYFRNQVEQDRVITSRTSTPSPPPIMPPLHSVHSLHSVPHHRTQMNTILSKMYPTSEITKIQKPLLYSFPYSSQDTTNSPALLTPNLFMMKRANFPKILIESKVGEQNVPMEEYTHFIELMKTQHSHGILISQHSGFYSKPNYHIECHDHQILVFVHQAEYSQDKIKPAIEIIDILSAKIKQYSGTISGSEGDMITELIEKNVLDEINKEYQLFVSQKEAIIQGLRESQRKVVSQIEEFKFPSLDRYLSSKFTAPMPRNGHKCDLCKTFMANNLKALAAHKRGCARKQGTKPGVEDKAKVNIEIDFVDDASYTNHFVGIVPSVSRSIT